MYKIIASDLDGTLLTPDHKIAPFTQKVLKDLHREGKHFVIATARHHISAGRIREQTGIPAYMVTSNGACIYNSMGELIFKKLLNSDVILEIIATTKNIPGIHIYIYHGDIYHISRELKDSNVNYPLFDVNNPPVDNVMKMSFTFDDHNPESLNNLNDIFNSTFNGKVNSTFSAAWCIDVMASGVSKGNGVEIVAKSLGYELKDCIAFGDDMNDTEMLSMVGKGLIMKTANEKMKERLPNNEVIGSCSEESVAHYLNKNVLSNSGVTS